jgi:hypothetical protein
MKITTFERDKKDELYKHSAVPFINTLLALNVPLSAIDTNDFHTNYNPRVYVTREYGRENGGTSRKAHISQFGHKAAERLAKFYHS